MRRLPDETRLRVWRALLRVHAGVTTALDDALQETRGIPLTWYQVLVELRLAGGAMRMHRLAEVATLSRSGATRLVDRIEAEGLVARRVCPSDRRGLEVVLTPEGAAVQKAAGPLVLRGIQDRLGRHLTDDQATSLAELLEGLMEAEHPGSAARRQ